MIMVKRLVCSAAILILALALLSFTSSAVEKSMIEKTPFGKLPDGREVFLYTLTNASGCKVGIINYGAIVRSIVVPDKDGKFQDVVLGYDSLQGYIQDKSYFGAIVGRYGNRIARGRFRLDGKEYQLTINDGENHLHGGKKGFFKAYWDATIVDDTLQPSLALTLTSPDGDEGYPGTVTVTVTYTLTSTDELRIDYKGTTDKETILNPTHHSYFNLSGDLNNTILDELLTIEADSITPVDRELIPTGAIIPVAGTPMDFRTPKTIGSRINESYEQLLFGRGYDHNWVLRDYSGKVRRAAEVYDPRSGRLMTVFTDQPGLQFYSGNFLDGTIKGKDGVVYKHRSGLCLEAQHFPDSPNKPNFPSVVLKPGEVYHQTTIYQFSTK
jgi:aldose 1-epimerase